MSSWQVIGPKNSSPTPSNANSWFLPSVTEFRLHRALLAAVIVAWLLLTSVSCASVASHTEETPTANATAEAAVPLSSSVVRNDAVLATALDQLLDGPEYRTARWGIAVVSLSDGKLLYGRNHDHLFTP